MAKCSMRTVIILNACVIPVCVFGCCFEKKNRRVGKHRGVALSTTGWAKSIQPHVFIGFRFISLSNHSGINTVRPAVSWFNGGGVMQGGLERHCHAIYVGHTPPPIPVSAVVDFFVCVCACLRTFCEWISNKQRTTMTTPTPLHCVDLLKGGLH